MALTKTTICMISNPSDLHDYFIAGPFKYLQICIIIFAFLKLVQDYLLSRTADQFQGQMWWFYTNLQDFENSVSKVYVSYFHKINKNQCCVL